MEFATGSISIEPRHPRGDCRVRDADCPNLTFLPGFDDGETSDTTRFQEVALRRGTGCLLWDPPRRVTFAWKHDDWVAPTEVA
jgi:hypothetical protein